MVFEKALFQYIPCYGLSTRQLVYFIIFAHFNTSHVTVYLQDLSHPVLKI